MSLGNTSAGSATGPPYMSSANHLQPHQPTTAPAAAAPPQILSPPPMPSSSPLMPLFDNNPDRISSNSNVYTQIWWPLPLSLGPHGWWHNHTSFLVHLCLLLLLWTLIVRLTSSVHMALRCFSLSQRARLKSDGSTLHRACRDIVAFLRTVNRFWAWWVLGLSLNFVCSTTKHFCPPGVEFSHLTSPQEDLCFTNLH